MTELTAAEKAEIRFKAYDRATCMTIGKGDEKRMLTLSETIAYADDIAAWAMSGHLPGPATSPAEQ